MNPDGAVRGHLRTNACGANLNREWCSDETLTLSLSLALSLSLSPSLTQTLTLTLTLTLTRCTTTPSCAWKQPGAQESD
eukprot:scaffold54421_cov25-Phaeocystis_antarctica.AAC.1